MFSGWGEAKFEVPTIYPLTLERHSVERIALTWAIQLPVLTVSTDLG